MKFFSDLIIRPTATVFIFFSSWIFFLFISLLSPVSIISSPRSAKCSLPLPLLSSSFARRFTSLVITSKSSDSLLLRFLLPWPMVTSLAPPLATLLPALVSLWLTSPSLDGLVVGLLTLLAVGFLEKCPQYCEFHDDIPYFATWMLFSCMFP